MTMPTFLIIGAMKSGTTTLYRLLEQHPEIYMSSVKEPNFFAYIGGRPKRAYPSGLRYPEWIIDSSDAASRAMEMRVNAASFTTLTAYKRLWQDVSKAQKGEASVLYLYLPHVAKSIARIKPDMKLIVILRNPVDRAFSHFQMARRIGREPIDSFAEAMEAEQARLEQNYDPFWHYRNFGYYYQQLERYFKFFDRSQIMIILNEDLRRQSDSVYARLLHFLTVDCSFKPGPEKEFGVGGVPRSQRLYEFLNQSSAIKAWSKRVLPTKYHTRLYKNFVMSRPTLSSSLRRQLTALYTDDVISLEKLIDRDLSHWTTVPSIE
ncbi:MAG: sulfotransferase [Anaerolineaceae bacterium]|nr:MAG: sulfotransferase [Anaerolineaceae bacterium]